MILYHGTAAALVPLILKKGLIPKAGKGGDAWAMKYRPGLAAQSEADENRNNSVYVTTDLTHAVWFGKMAAEVNGSEPAVVRVELPDSEPLLYDEQGGADYLLRHPGPIDPKEVSILPREYWQDIDTPPLPKDHFMTLIREMQRMMEGPDVRG